MRKAHLFSRWLSDRFACLADHANRDRLKDSLELIELAILGLPDEQRTVVTSSDRDEPGVDEEIEAIELQIGRIYLLSHQLDLKFISLDPLVLLRKCLDRLLLKDCRGVPSS